MMIRLTSWVIVHLGLTAKHDEYSQLRCFILTDAAMLALNCKRWTVEQVVLHRGPSSRNDDAEDDPATAIEVVGRS
jgi:hypothetical protein